MAGLPKNVGWIGLGIMGLPMARNLLKKMGDDTQFYVFDVIQESVDNFVQDGQGRVSACSSSKDVADKSVRSSSHPTYLRTFHAYEHRTSSYQWSQKEATCDPST